MNTTISLLFLNVPAPAFCRSCICLLKAVMRSRWLFRPEPQPDGLPSGRPDDPTAFEIGKVTFGLSHQYKVNHNSSQYKRIKGDTTFTFASADRTEQKFFRHAFSSGNGYNRWCLLVNCIRLEFATHFFKMSSNFTIENYVNERIAANECKIKQCEKQKPSGFNNKKLL
jgi:hypothetical protein